jgi:hypothetical protein
MSRKLASRARSVGTRLAYGYAAAGVVLLAILARRADTLAGWMWASLLVLVFLAVSLRSALVFTYRKTPSKLNGWIRPMPHEKEFTATWLVYAVFFGAMSVLIVLLSLLRGPAGDVISSST